MEWPNIFLLCLSPDTFLKTRTKKKKPTSKAHRIIWRKIEMNGREKLEVNFPCNDRLEDAKSPSGLSRLALVSFSTIVDNHSVENRFFFLKNHENYKWAPSRVYQKQTMKNGIIFEKNIFNTIFSILFFAQFRTITIW